MQHVGYESAKEAVFHSVRSIADFTRLLADRTHCRIINNVFNERKLANMRDCLDLRQLCKPGYNSSNEQASLIALAKLWARDNVSTIANDETLWSQHQMLKQRLQVNIEMLHDPQLTPCV